jgi:hypothetical protein
MVDIRPMRQRYAGDMVGRARCRGIVWFVSLDCSDICHCQAGESYTLDTTMLFFSVLCMVVSKGSKTETHLLKEVVFLFTVSEPHLYLVTLRRVE